MAIELIEEVVLHRDGPFARVRRYYKGRHPHLGYIHDGWSGEETVQEVDVIRPSGMFHVKEAACGLNSTTG